MELFQYYLDAFSELSSCRNSGMGIGPIPFTAILEYFKLFGVEDFEEFLYYIRKMDNAYVILANDKINAESKNNSAAKVVKK